ncbi:MAG: amidohydrolase [Rhodospirillaceae bacterium]|nr:amidohydrolase [Rhodospirillaceae bacterium]MBT7955895.1 amidohydrolase [Rhodospirillaceae bacterium]
MTVIDIHTHSLSEKWLNLVREKGKPDLEIGTHPNGNEFLIEFGTPSMGLTEGMFDYQRRIKDMDAEGIDVSIVSLTSPNTFWGTEEIGVECARIMNDDMAAAQTSYPDRIRFFATLPWEYPKRAAEELERAVGLGAVGVMTLANVRGKYLNDQLFDPVWTDIEKRGLPVLIHPTIPLGSEKMDLGTHRLAAPVGFMFDTTLAIARMIMDGFIDRYPNIKIIAAHAGGFLPYVSKRMDLFFEKAEFEKKITDNPSTYLERIYYDSIIYQADGLQSLINLAGPDRIMFGTDYPHPADIPVLKQLVADLPTDQSTKIFGTAAERLFKL